MTPKESIRLKVPSFRQHYDFTCGPASLMMAMKYFDGSMGLTKELEMGIWREGNMIEIYGTSRYGLAFSAAIRGFTVMVFSNVEGFGFVDKLTPRVEGLNRKMLRLFFEERRKRCLKLGVRERRVKSITIEILRAALLSNELPLLLTSSRFFGEKDDLPHWIVVTGLTDREILVNNPLGARGSSPFQLTTLRDLIGYKGDQCMVTVTKK